MAADHPPVSSRYKWTALSNTTLGAFMATLDSSIVIISRPAIFRGIQLDPLEPSNISYLLWMQPTLPGPIDDDVGEALEETVLA